MITIHLREKKIDRIKISQTGYINYLPLKIHVGNKRFKDQKIKSLV